MKQHRDKPLIGRDKILRRWFKAFTQRGIYETTEYHAFCIDMKGKSESKIIEELEVKSC